LRARSAKEALGVVEAMVAGGVTVIEVTMTVPGAIDVLKELKRSYGSRLLLGSGTVTDGAECAATIEAGAEFVVSPSLHMDVIAETKKRDKVSLPGFQNSKIISMYILMIFTGLIILAALITIGRDLRILKQDQFHAAIERSRFMRLMDMIFNKFLVWKVWKKLLPASMLLVLLLMRRPSFSKMRPRTK